LSSDLVAIIVADMHHPLSTRSLLIASGVNCALAMVRVDPRTPWRLPAGRPARMTPSLLCHL